MKIKKNDIKPMLNQINLVSVKGQKLTSLCWRQKPFVLRKIRKMTKGK